MKKILTAAMLAALAAAAQAQLSYSGGALQSFASYNPAGTGDGSSVATAPHGTGWLNPTLLTGVGGTLTATFLGDAAGHNNSFWVNGSQVFSNSATAVGTSVGIAVAAGALSWQFKDLNDGTTVGNGGNGDNNNVHGSFVVLGSRNQAGGFDPYTKGGQFDLVIAFNDGARVDADYDDHVVGLRLAPVPEPATTAMLLAGLAITGFVVRRRVA